MVNETNLRTIGLMPIWSQRPKEISPKWNWWFVAETYNLLEQLWRDVLVYTPRELIASEPLMGKMEINLINNGRYKFRSGRNEEYLVAEGLDGLSITEAGELPRRAVELLLSRLSSPDRLEYATLFANGTPRGQVDPASPDRDHWFWAEIKAGRDGSYSKDYQESWYWFEDRRKYGNLEHPILSLTVQGQIELNLKRNDPNLSERKFREDYLGECLPAVLGKPITPEFYKDEHVREIDFQPRYPLYRSWDFGRLYPAVYFHQITKDNVWLIHDEFVGIDADLIDEELADKVTERTKKMFRNADGSALERNQVFDYGDFESTHKEDSRRESTIEMLKTKGIDLVVTPTKHGDEALAEDVINARLKLRHTGMPNLLIHPRCKMLIRCLEGMWVHETGKIGDYSYYKTEVAEIHPWIDIFDSIKYFIVDVLDPQQQKFYSEQKVKKEIKGKLKTDPVTGMMYYART